MQGESSSLHLDDELVAHVAASASLSPGTARRVVEDVLAYHAETVAGYVARRHRELAEQGEKNAAIYARLQDEVAARLFPGPRCSARQIRRMIYG